MRSSKNSALKLLPKLDRKLMLAVRRGNFTLVKSLLDNCKVNINCADEDQRTCLHFAIKRNNINIIRLLLARNINVNPDISHREAPNSVSLPLSFAIELRRRKAAKLLIRAGADVNAQLDGRTTPLWIAVQLSEVSLTRLLLDYGAAPSSILVVAYGSNSSVRVIKTILDRALLYSAQFLHYARSLIEVLFWHDDEEAIRLLIDRPEVRLTWDARKMIYGMTPLHFAPLRAVRDRAIVVRLLLERGVELDARETTDSMTALHVTLARGKPNMARELINSGADVNAMTISGLSPLHQAVRFCGVETTELLISKGADLNARANSSQITALHFVCRFHNKGDITRALLVNGADPLLKSAKGKTALQSLPDLDSEAARQLVRRLTAVMLAEKRQIDDKDFELIMQRPQLLEYRNQCAAEIERMRKLLVYQDFTLLRVQFVMSEDRLAKMMRNEDFLISFKSKLLEERFPLYEDFIYTKLKRAEEKMKTRRAIKEHLQDMFTPHLPDLILERIIKYLSISDILF